MGSSRITDLLPAVENRHTGVKVSRKDASAEPANQCSEVYEVEKGMRNTSVNGVNSLTKEELGLNPMKWGVDESEVKKNCEDKFHDSR